tara:strand:- start:43 stop:1071 length:1029 start_codon:yes stop_codon:yes gene_type:complete
MSAIHKRLYQSLKCEFMLLADCFATYLPKEYPYDVVGGEKQIFVQDFDKRVDIIPVADPNIFSQTQRISVAQTQMQIAMSNPQMHDLYQVYRNMYEALGIKDIDLILKKPEEAAPMDPAMENIQALSAGTFKAFEGQDHQAHMAAHLSFMGTVSVRNNPQVLGSLQKNILEHINLMAQEQTMLEFTDEMAEMQQMQQQMAQMQQQMGQNPQAQAQMAQNPQLKQQQDKMKDLTQKIEARKAILVAETMAEYVAEEQKVLNPMDTDPLLKLKSDELRLKTQEENRKREEGEAEQEMDALKMISSRQLAEDKLQQDDKHANLRASVSLAKNGIKQMQSSVKTKN